MSKQKRGLESPSISLTGGLGNQLFQLAFGLWASSNSILTVESRVGQPRTNAANAPELCSFILPRKVIVREPIKYSNIASKFVNHKLRLGLYKNSYEKLYLYQIIVGFLANQSASYILGNKVKVIAGIGNGYSTKLKPIPNAHYVGYFQSYKWVENDFVKQQMMSLHISKEGDDLRLLRELAEKEYPLVVHIRLGDYLNDSDRGIPSVSYYNQAITELWQSGVFSKIWLFSDQADEAVKYIDLKWEKYLRVIREVDNSSASTLEAMRLGKGYVIGNSTFSWWGAYLTHSPDATVIAPYPWFKNSPSPIELIPQNWQAYDSK